MAITILPREESAGEGLGTAFGRGLSGVLQRQAEIASQLKMRELLKGLERKEGLPALEKAFPGKGEMLLNMPAEMRVPYMKELISQPGRERFSATLSRALSQGGAQQGYMQQPMGQGAQAPMQQQPGQAEQQGAIQAGQGQESTSGIPGLIDISQVDFSGLDEMKALEAMNAIEKHNNAIIKEHGQESRFQREMDEKRQNRLNKMTEAQAARADKYHQESQPYFEELLSKATAAKEEVVRLRRMESQVASGELPDADWVNMANGLSNSIFGKIINFNTLIGPEGEEFNKEVNELASTWAGHLGGKVTDTRLKMIKDSIVSLLHTPEGKIRIIKNMMALRNMDIAKYNIASGISEKNSYLRPIGFREMVEKSWDEERGKYERDYLNMFSDKPGSEQIAEKYINKIGGDTEGVVDTPEVQAAAQSGPQQPGQAAPTISQQDMATKATQQDGSSWASSLSSPFDAKRDEQFRKDLKYIGKQGLIGIGGAPGDLEYLITGAAALGSRALNKLIGTPVSPWPSEIKKAGYMLPTMSELAERYKDSDEAPGAIARFTGDVVGRIANAYAFGGALGTVTKAAVPFANIAKGALFGETARTVAEIAHMPKAVQGFADVTGTLLGSLSGPRKQLIETYNKFYPEAESYLQNVRINIDPYVNVAQESLDKLTGAAPKASKAIRDVLEDIGKLGNNVSADKLIQQDQALGAIMREMPKRYKPIVGKLQSSIEGLLDDVASKGKDVAEAVYKYRTARSAYSAVKSGTDFMGFAEEHLPATLKSILSNPVRLWYGLKSIVKAAGVAAPAVAVGAPAIPIYNSIQAMRKSPQAVKLYTDAYKAFLANSPSAFIKATKALDKKVKRGL